MVVIQKRSFNLDFAGDYKFFVFLFLILDQLASLVLNIVSDMVPKHLERFVES